MVEIRKKKGESFEAMYRRFSKRMMQSKKILEAKGRKFLQPKKNKNAQKESALVGLQFKKEKEYQRKIGKLVDEPRRRW